MELDSDYVRKWYPQNDSITTIAGNGMPGSSGDGGLAVNASIEVALALCANGSNDALFWNTGVSGLRKIGGSNQIISTLAGNGSFAYTTDSLHADSSGLSMLDITCTADGIMFFSDFANNRVRKLDTTHIISTLAGNGFLGFSGDGGPATSADIGSPYGITHDGEGNVYFSANNRIRRVDTAGIITTVIGSGASGYNGDNIPAVSASLDSPGLMCMLSDSILGFVDANNGLLRSVNLNTGIINSFCGQVGQFGFAGDGGPANAAITNGVFGMVADSSGNIYFADRNNNRIRKINGPSWALTGTPTCSDIGQHPITIGVTNGIDTVYQSFTITVQDTVAPTLTCPTNQTTYTTDTPVSYTHLTLPTTSRV